MHEESNKKRRYAIEWYVDEKDRWYWKRTDQAIKNSQKKTTTLASLGVAASITAIIISLSSLLHKSQ